MIVAGCYSILVKLKEDIPQCKTIHDVCPIFKNKPYDTRYADVLLEVSEPYDLLNFFKEIEPLPVYITDFKFLGDILFCGSCQPFKIDK